jgi:hypothetical protein
MAKKKEKLNIGQAVDKRDYYNQELKIGDVVMIPADGWLAFGILTNATAYNVSVLEVWVRPIIGTQEESVIIKNRNYQIRIVIKCSDELLAAYPYQPMIRRLVEERTKLFEENAS